MYYCIIIEGCFNYTIPLRNIIENNYNGQLVLTLTSLNKLLLEYYARIFFACKKFWDLEIGPSNPQTKNLRGLSKSFHRFGERTLFFRNFRNSHWHQNYKEVLKCTV